MATLIRAVARFGPRLVAAAPVEAAELHKRMTAGTGLSAPVARMMLGQLADVLLFFLRRGSAVRLPGIGRLRVFMNRDGILRLHLVPDKLLLAALQDHEHLTATVEHAERIGWTDADYKAMWDAEYPDDPLEIGPPRQARIKRLSPGRPRPGDLQH